MAENKIILKDVNKHYQMGENLIKALDNVDLEIENGELLCILGPSGSGKTTLLNVLGGISTPTDGIIKVFGENIENYDEKNLSNYRNKRVGFIFQFFNLFPTLNALENIEISLEMFEKNTIIRETAKKFLKSVNLEDRMNHFPSQLSGGQQQRVAIARALAKQPFVDGNFLILCDEPTGNLDENTGNTIIDLIKQMNEEFGVTFIIVTHNEEISKRLNAKKIHIHNGKVSVIGQA